jgi:hypothetical protein
MKVSGHGHAAVTSRPEKDTSVFNGEEELRTIRKIPLIFAFVLCGCESWSFTLREQHRLRIFENRVLRRTFGRKRLKVTGH